MNSQSEQVDCDLRLANQFVEEYEQYTSASYDIDYQIKYFIRCVILKKSVILYIIIFKTTTIIILKNIQSKI